jgi:magnesium-transporting ATPase (P-type)
LLGFAWKPLEKKNNGDESDWSLEEIEKALKFTGISVLENRLKPSSAEIVRQINEYVFSHISSIV